MSPYLNFDPAYVIQVSKCIWNAVLTVSLYNVHQYAIYVLISKKIGGIFSMLKDSTLFCFRL